MNRTCLKCGWVHFGVTRKYAEDEVSKFNAFYDASTPGVQASYGNRHSSIQTYERCGLCGAQYTQFRDTVEGDCPDGCTLGPIIVPAE